MGCEICGRNSCCASFHSIEEQNSFDAVADGIKDRAIRVISKEIDKLKGHHHGDNYYVKLEDVLRIISEYN